MAAMLAGLNLPAETGPNGLNLSVKTVYAQNMEENGTANPSTSNDGFVIEEGLLTTLTQYTGEGGDIEIPEGVEKIGKNAFQGCASLTSVKIPKSCGSIGEYAFEGCQNLKSVDFPDNINISELHDGHLKTA